MVNTFLNKLLNTAQRFEEKAEGYFLFTPSNLVYLSLDKKAKSILDLGCGKGNRMKFFNRQKRYHTVGVDLFAPYLEICRKANSHDEYFLCDITRLPFEKKSFDIVLGLGVLEHQSKEDGAKLLADMESLARKQVIVLVPSGPVEQLPFDDNPYQEHKSAWTIVELIERGYKIRASGLRYIPVSKIRTGYVSRFIDLFWHIVWVLTGPLVFFFPSLGGELIGIKNFDAHEEI